jgi:ornithine carbamoyltransferase
MSPTSPFPHRHLVDLAEYSREDISSLLDLAAKMKADPGAYRSALSGKTLGMVFEKPSTRTRVSFEVGIYQLGGYGLYLGRNDLQIGRGESIPDTARVLSRYLDGIMARTFRHDTITALAEHGSVPIINGLSDLLHPCQALADYQTIREHKGALDGLKVCYVGDGNNVLHSLVNAGVKLGCHMHYACPEGYDPDPTVMGAAQDEAKKRGVDLVAHRDAHEAVRGVDVIYADVWTSMGQEGEESARNTIFEPYQINEALVADADPNYLFMHCLPAHRGEEVTDAVCDSPNSVIFDEAENRLHAQKAVMLTLMA